MKKCALLWASNPKCAHCNKKLETSFIDAVFPKGFRRGQLRIQAIKNLLEQEMSLLPQSSIRLQEIKLQERIASLFNELRTLTEIMRTSPFLKFPLKRLGELEDAFKDCQANNKKTIVRKTTKCPKEDCRGYIPSGLKCPMCQTSLCSDCNASKAPGLEHSCSLEDISSWSAIKDTTVPCPKCSMRIEKISGCNQMWCTIKNCNTAFDWATGKIINGPMHNPHYHEYLRTLAPLATNQEDHIACQTPRNKMSNARINDVGHAIRRTGTRGNLALKGGKDFVRQKRAQRQAVGIAISFLDNLIGDTGAAEEPVAVKVGIGQFNVQQAAGAGAFWRQGLRIGCAGAVHIAQGRRRAIAKRGVILRLMAGAAAQHGVQPEQQHPGHHRGNQNSDQL